MISRKQEIRSPKLCSKGSCYPQQLLQKHPLRVRLSHMFARRPSMWCSCHPFLPVTADSSRNHALCALHFLLHTAHPLHTPFSLQVWITDIERDWAHLGDSSSSNTKAKFKTSEKSASLHGDLVGQESFPEQSGKQNNPKFVHQHRSTWGLGQPSKKLPQVSVEMLRKQ